MSDSPEITKRYTDIARTLREEVLAGRFGSRRTHAQRGPARQTFRSFPPDDRTCPALAGRRGTDRATGGSGSFVKSGGAKETARSNWLALLIPNLGNTEIFQMIGGEIASLARMHNFGLVWSGSENPQVDPGHSEMESLCKQFIERNVAGVFFAPYELLESSEQVNQSMALMLREAGIPVVLLDRDLTRFPMRGEFDLVCTDNFAGGFMLAEHLIKLGCRRIHFVARPLSAPTVDARIAGVREALARHRINADPAWIRIGTLDDKKFIRGLTGPLQPDAYICANDHTAAVVMRELQKNQIRVPDDVRVLGFDDVKFATLVSPALTTIQQPCREIAQTAFRAMMDRLVTRRCRPGADACSETCHQGLAPGAYLPKAR